MKTLSRLILLLSVALFAACEGPAGPPGMPGEDGLDGVNILGTTFEIQGSFTPANEYMLYYQFPSNFEVYDGDVVMVYILWELSDGTDVWRALPQTQFFNEGPMIYNFDFTLNDVQIYIDGTINPDILAPEWTDDQVFRIAVLPSDLAQNNSVDINNYESVMRALNRPMDSVQQIQVK